MENGFSFVKKTGGIASESQYPYTSATAAGTRGSCAPSKQKPVAKYTDGVSGFTEVTRDHRDHVGHGYTGHNYMGLVELEHLLHVVMGPVAKYTHSASGFAEASPQSLRAQHMLTACIAIQHGPKGDRKF